MGEGGSSTHVNDEWILQTFTFSSHASGFLLDKGARLWNMNNWRSHPKGGIIRSLCFLHCLGITTKMTEPRLPPGRTGWANGGIFGASSTRSINNPSRIQLVNWFVILVVCFFGFFFKLSPRNTCGYNRLELMRFGWSVFYFNSMGEVNCLSSSLYKWITKKRRKKNCWQKQGGRGGGEREAKGKERENIFLLCEPTCT